MSTKRARRTALMKQAGPYSVYSLADGTLRVYPAWPRHRDPEVPMSSAGVFTRGALAEDIETFLNGRKSQDRVVTR